MTYIVVKIRLLHLGSVVIDELDWCYLTNSFLPSLNIKKYSGSFKVLKISVHIQKQSKWIFLVSVKKTDHYL